MNVQITGCKDLALKDELLVASHFFGKILLSHQMLPYIDVEILMKTNTSDLGSCTVTYYNDWYRPRQFEIVLKRHKSRKNTLKTLAHEMVHLKQFAKGELNLDQDKWHKTHIDTEAIPYIEWPWEKEAAACEIVMYDLYRQKHHFTN